MLIHETKIRLSKALLFLDAFTGEPISSGIRVRSLSGGRTEKKGGGYFLILDAVGAQMEIETESPIYQRRQLSMPIDYGAELSEVFLYPSPAYPLGAGTTVVRGMARPGQTIRFYMEDEQACCRLIGDYEKGEGQISFYQKGARRKNFWHIGKKQRKAGEYFDVKRADGDAEIFKLGRPLKAAYNKKDTVIYPAQETAADEDGAFYLLLGDVPKDVCILYYSFEEAGKEVCGEAEIQRAQENHVDI